MNGAGTLSSLRKHPRLSYPAKGSTKEAQCKLSPYEETVKVFSFETEAVLKSVHMQCQVITPWA